MKYKNWGLLLMSWIISISLMLSGCAFMPKKCRQYLHAATTQTYDLIVVPGVPLEDGHWSRTMKARVYWSKYLYDHGIAKNIMYSGSAVYTPYYEGEVMAMYAEAIGIPKENIFTETKAEHSTENIYYSYKKAKLLHFNRIALATDPFQSKSLRRFIALKVSKDVDLIPIVFDTLKSMEPIMQDPIIDFEKVRVKDFEPLPARESFGKRWRGTRGLNIDTTLYETLLLNNRSILFF